MVPTNEGLMPRMNDDWDRSFDRVHRTEQARWDNLGFSFTRQGQALTRKYYPVLANRIADGLRDKEIRAALRKFDKDLDNTRLAVQLLVAGVNICASDNLGIHDGKKTYDDLGIHDGKKTYRDIAISMGGFFGVTRDRELALKIGGWGINMLLSLPVFALDGEVLILAADVHDFLDDVLARETAINPLLSPTDAPPVPWTQVSKGGLSPDHWARRSLVRRQASEGVWRKAIADGRMQPTLDAINHLQSPAFTINKPVLDFMMRRGFSRPKLGDLKEWSALSGAWHLDMAKAEMLASLDQFYIPLRFEFRGRVVPIPLFHYQRDDSIRGLFLFRDGEPIGSNSHGPGWLLLYPAKFADGNRYGKPSKLSLHDRCAWAIENIDTITRIGNEVLSGASPGKLAELIDVNEPCQFIAACCEVAQAHNRPDFITRLPILVDATNSALQHWGSMVRAPEVRYANITTGPDIDDFYLRIAGDIYPEHMSLMRGPDDRGIVKGAIVAQFYGSKPGSGMRDQIMAELKDRGIAADKKSALKLASAIDRAIKGRTPLVEGAKKFVRAVAGCYAGNGKHFHWTTPLGLPVLNAYNTKIFKRVRTPFNGGWKWTKLAIGYKDEIDDDARRAAVRGASANLIHSLDACHLQMVALQAAKQNIQLMTIHDCFGCIATRSAQLFDIVRIEFDRLYPKDRNMLADILEQAKSDLPDAKLPVLPEMGNEDISQILKSFGSHR
jgi:DNA-directed RNA polymerase